METDRRGSFGLGGEVESEDACAGGRADALAPSIREHGDDVSQIGAFTEEENHRNLGLSNYLSRSSARSPSSLIVRDLPPKEYQLTKDEFEFTKDYLNKDFRKYETSDLNNLSELYQKLDYERSKKDLDVPKLSKVEVERLRKSLFSDPKNSEYFNEKSGFKKPDYIIKNSEFLQKSNELLSKITKERNYKKPDGIRDLDNRLLSDYRKALKESSNEFGLSKDELSLQNFGSIRLRTGSLSRSYDDSDRLRYEVDGFRSSKHHLESDVRHEDEDERDAEGISAYTKGIANLLAGYTNIVTMAKGIGNGFPLAAVVTTPEISKCLTKAHHFNTYGGNPLASAVGLKVLEVIESEGLQENSKKVGTNLLLKLKTLRDEYEIIGDVRGKGLMIGIEFVSDKNSKKSLKPEIFGQIWEKCKESGVLIGVGGLYGNVMRVKPPMCITEEDADLTFDVLEKAIKTTIE